MWPYTERRGSTMRIHKPLTLVTVFLCLLAQSTTGAQPAYEPDSLVLVDFYNVADGDGWQTNSGWLQEPLQDWYGIELDNDGRVVTIQMTGNKMRGSISPELGKLSSLEWLWLDGGQLSGPIPRELGKLFKLQMLRLADNQLDGSVPRALGNLTELRYLILDENELSGSIPPELGNLSNLELLQLGNNRLSGPIPRQFARLHNLSILSLDNNEIGGPIPPELGNLERLNYLFLSNNKLSGAIPRELGKLTELRRLVLGQNQLGGSIPAEFRSLGRLRFLEVQHNFLEGLPDLSGLSSLRTLNVSHNRLTFEDLEPNAVFIGRITFRYAFQDSITTNVEITSANFTFTLDTGGDSNEYRWYRDGEVIPGAVHEELTIPRDYELAMYHARVTNEHFPALTLWSRPRAPIDPVTAAEDTSPGTITFGLYPSYPNPFAKVSHISFDLERPVHVRITVYDLLGRRVRMLVDSPRPVGRHRVPMDAAELAPGLYHYSMQAGDFHQVRAMMVIR